MKESWLTILGWLLDLHLLTFPLYEHFDVKIPGEPNSGFAGVYFMGNVLTGLGAAGIAALTSNLWMGLASILNITSPLWGTALAYMTATVP